MQRVLIGLLNLAASVSLAVAKPLGAASKRGDVAIGGHHDDAVVSWISTKRVALLAIRQRVNLDEPCGAAFAVRVAWSITIKLPATTCERGDHTAMTRQNHRWEVDVHSVVFGDSMPNLACW